MWSFVPEDRACASYFNATACRAGIRVAGNSTAGGEGETSSIVGATEAGSGGKNGTGSPDNTPNGTRAVSGGTGARRGHGSGAGSPGSASQVLVQVLVFYFVVMDFGCCFAVGYRATRTHSMSVYLRL